MCEYWYLYHGYEFIFLLLLRGKSGCCQQGSEDEDEEDMPVMEMEEETVQILDIWMNLGFPNQPPSQVFEPQIKSNELEFLAH